MSISRKVRFRLLVIVLPIFILFLLIGIILTVLNHYWNSLIPNVQTSISGNPVQNYYNNYLAGGQMCRVGNTLYLNYYKTNHNYGLLEIQEKRCRRVFWRGPQLFAINTNIPDIFQDQSKLYQVQNPYRAYDPVKNKFYKDAQKVTVSPFYNKEHYFYQSQIRGISSDLIEVNGNQKKVIENGNADLLYLTKNAIYYICKSDINSHQNGVLIQYDTGSKKKTKLFTWSPGSRDSIQNFIVENDNIIIETTNSLLLLQLTTHTKQNLRFEYRRVNSLNAYNNQVYVCAENGVFRYDLNLQHTDKLSSITGDQIYIVDDTWVYVRTKDYSWYRIRQDGTGEVETILE